MVTVVLFDIDGTLVQTGRAGVRGLTQAFVELFGTHDALEGIPVAGRTDRAIVGEALRRVGQADDAATVTRVREAYCRRLPAALADPGSAPIGVLPGVVSLLEALERREDVAVGLLTGNFAAGAALKLGHFRLWERFPFGAFGDDYVDRRALVPVARTEAAGRGHHTASPSQVVVIGDTPLDVDCAQAHGARSLAVATGLYDTDQLRASGADLTVSSLDEVTADWF